MINSYWDNLRPLGWVLIGLSILAICWKYQVGRRIIIWLQSTEARVYNKVEVWSFKRKVKTEEDWLDLIVEFIDLQKRPNLEDREIVIKFQINSRLKYEYQPYRIYVTPILNGYSPSKSEFSMTENLLPNRVSMWSSKTVKVEDERLWELVQIARQGNVVPKALKVEIQPRPGVSAFVLKGEPKYEL